MVLGQAEEYKKARMNLPIKEYDVEANQERIHAVELLVVIGIIGLLMSILVPGVKRVYLRDDGVQNQYAGDGSGVCPVRA